MAIRTSMFVVAAIIAVGFFKVNSSAQAIPKPGEQFQAASTDGMWTWYGEPKAVYYEGKYRRTYMTWTKGTGEKEVVYYDHDSLKLVSAITPKMPYNGSDHNHPSIIARPDGRLAIFCSGHDGGEITEYISKNPEDISSWDGPYYPGGKGGYCYMNVMFLKNEGTKGRMYLFFRDNTKLSTTDSVSYCPSFCTSDDWGVTWSGKTRLYEYVTSAYKPYLKYACDGLSTIHIAIEYQNRQGDGKSRPVYYMKYKGGTFYNAAGKTITTIDKMPVYNTMLDTIFYSYTYGAGFSNTCCDIAYDANNNPVILFCSFQSQTLYEYWYMRWTGTAWYKRPLINSGAYRGAQGGFFAGLTFDHENPNNIYLCRQLLKPSGTPFNLMDTSVANYKTLKSTAWTTIDTVHELDRWTTPDGGLTWDTTLAITRNSLNKNMLPCVPRNHKVNMKIDCMWLNGVYTSMSAEGYDCAVRLFPFKDGEKLPQTSALSQAAAQLPAENISVSRSGIAFTVAGASRPVCKMYALDGRRIADLGAQVSRNGEVASIAFSKIKAANGTYLFEVGSTAAKTIKAITIGK
jgi:hypothetical protein